MTDWVGYVSAVVHVNEGSSMHITGCPSTGLRVVTPIQRAFPKGVADRIRHIAQVKVRALRVTATEFECG